MIDDPGVRKARSQTVADVKPRRAKYENLDWNTHKPMIQHLYMGKNRSLADTMEIMKEKYSFEAS